jgi:hypothetical protein
MDPVELTKQNPGLDQPATYQIRVEGRLDERWSDWFEGMTVTVEREGDGPPITTLTGTVADQAALQGMLRTLYTLGLPVRSVTCVDSDTAARPGSEQEPNGLP